MGQINYKLCTICHTYNQSLYIEETFNGFCMQETDFPFVCAIIDDCSTDGEPEIIQNYLQEHFDLEDKSIVRNEETDDYVLTFVRHKTNVNCFFVVLYLKYNHYSIFKAKRSYISEWLANVKYCALCEGDDYWIDPHKLQKQVDFLDNNTVYSCCVHEYKEWEEEKKCYRPHQLVYLKDFYGEGLSLGIDEYVKCIFFTKTLTVVYRTESLNNSKYNQYATRFDMTMFYALATQGQIYLMNQIMGVYRINDGGVTSKKNADGFRQRTLPYLFSLCEVEKTKQSQKFVYFNLKPQVLYILLKRRDLLLMCYKYLNLKYNLGLLLQVFIISFDIIRTKYKILIK